MRWRCGRRLWGCRDICINNASFNVNSQNSKSQMTIAPILLFSSTDFDEININEDTKIRKITNQELINLFDVDVKFEDQLTKETHPKNNLPSIWSPFIHGPLHELIKLTHYPYYTLEAKNATDITILLFCIRLAGPHEVFCPVCVDGERNTRGFIQYFIGQMECTRFEKIKESRIIDQDQLKIAKTLFDKLKTQNDNQTRYLKIIDAFNVISNNSLSNTIRYLIGVGLLESLFVNNKKDELSLRFRLFGAHLLKSAGATISQNELKGIYKNRSTLAHGQQAEINKKQLDRLIELCQIAIQHEIMTDSSQKIEQDVLASLGLS